LSNTLSLHLSVNVSDHSKTALLKFSISQ
jgi:hypothetical protein